MLDHASRSKWIDAIILLAVVLLTGSRPISAAEGTSPVFRADGNIRDSQWGHCIDSPWNRWYHPHCFQDVAPAGACDFPDGYDLSGVRPSRAVARLIGYRDYFILLLLLLLPRLTACTRAPWFMIMAADMGGRKMKISLGVNISPRWKARSQGVDLSSANAPELRYDLFLGDVVMRMDGLDLSTDWGWVPVLDFALGLADCVHQLEEWAPECHFEFTENEHSITLRRSGSENLCVTSSYTNNCAYVQISAFRDAVRSFVEQVCRDLQEEWPALVGNASFQRLASEALEP